MVFAEVQPVRAAPPTTGLVASAVQPNDGVRWEQGFAWRPERCITYDGFSACSDDQKTINPADDDVTYYMPNGFVVFDECTTLSSARDEERARRQAEAVTSRVVAEELWTGQLTVAYPATVDGAPYTNPYLTDGNATAVTFTATGTDVVVDALAALEAAAADAANGQQVFLHVPISWVLRAGDKLRRVGNILYTQLDNVVVADAGYPDGGVAYATGPVSVRLTSVDVISEPVFTVDRTTNRQRIMAERLFAAYFDPCVQLTVDITP